MFSLRLVPLLVLLLGAACLTAGSPATGARHRRSPFNTLPGGIPLTAVFALCEASAEDDNIGPCMADLLRGAIDKARPSFATGLKIGNDDIVLEPLKLDDIDPKRNKEFQVSVSNLNLHGISTLSINNITFSSEELALNLSFTNVSATGDVKLRYLFLSAEPRVRLGLYNLTVLVRSDWTLEINPDDPSRLDIVLSDASARFQLKNISVSFEDLGSVGIFLENIVNNNGETLARFLVPLLERNLSKKLNRKLNRIKIAD